MCSRAVANYMMSKAAIIFSPFLSNNVQKMASRLFRAMTGEQTTSTIPRWKKCLVTVAG